VKGLTALVLAGTRPGGDPLAAYAKVSHKALIDVGGRTMIARVVGALKQIPELTRIVIAIDRPELVADLVDAVPPASGAQVSTMPTAAGPSATVAAALERLATPLLVTTADHALLEPAWVREFIDACPPQLDAVVGMARAEAVRAAVPETQRTYLRFADVHYSGCNLFLLRRPASAGVVKFWQQLEAERKRPVRMLGRLGFGFALRYAIGRLSIGAAMARLSALTSAQVGIVELSDGRAAVDVDKPADLDLVRRLVG
jgi:GTP:adenosylcobinamide-phosphate guanylyltransferase